MAATGEVQRNGGNFVAGSPFSLPPLPPFRLPSLERTASLTDQVFRAHVPVPWSPLLNDSRFSPGISSPSFPRHLSDTVTSPYLGKRPHAALSPIPNEDNSSDPLPPDDPPLLQAANSTDRYFWGDTSSLPPLSIDTSSLPITTLLSPDGPNVSSPCPMPPTTATSSSTDHLKRLRPTFPSNAALPDPVDASSSSLPSPPVIPFFGLMGRKPADLTDGDIHPHFPKLYPIGSSIGFFPPTKSRHKRIGQVTEIAFMEDGAPLVTILRTPRGRQGDFKEEEIPFNKLSFPDVKNGDEVLALTESGYVHAKLKEYKGKGVYELSPIEDESKTFTFSVHKSYRDLSTIYRFIPVKNRVEHTSSGMERKPADLTDGDIHPHFPKLYPIGSSIGFFPPTKSKNKLTAQVAEIAFKKDGAPLVTILRTPRGEQWGFKEEEIPFKNLSFPDVKNGDEVLALTESGYVHAKLKEHKGNGAYELSSIEDESKTFTFSVLKGHKALSRIYRFIPVKNRALIEYISSGMIPMPLQPSPPATPFPLDLEDPTPPDSSSSCPLPLPTGAGAGGGLSMP